MSNCISPEEREALKQDLLSSLHCALPGIVVSFDPEAQAAEIRPALKAGGRPFPLLRDVPVFFPGPRDSAVTWPVAPGEECLVILADADIDAWLDSGEPEEPRSARKHSLSDAFAFVGFRSRPNALPDFPEGPALFAHNHDDLYYSKPETEKMVAALVPVERGGSGMTGTSATGPVERIAVPENNCEITAAQYCCWGKAAMVRLVVKKYDAVSSGTTTLCALVAGKRPKYTAPAEWRWNKGGQITTAGLVQVNGAIEAGESLTIYATYILA